jgi:hypothetical protein
VFVAALTSSAQADPISGGIALMIGAGYGSSVPEFVADMANPPYKGGQLGGEPILPPEGFGSGTISDSFNVSIVFNAASGANPTINVIGAITGVYTVTDLEPGNPLWSSGGFNFETSLRMEGTATSATLENWSPASGVPLSLINQYLNLSDYHFTETAGGLSIAAPYYDNLQASFSIDLPPAVPAPEPTTAILYVAAIGGLVVRTRFRGNSSRR